MVFKKGNKYRYLGKGFSGKKHSEETKIKIRESRAKQVYTEEQKVKQRENAKINPNYGMKGKHFSEESKQKMRLAKLGKKLSEEHIKKILPFVHNKSSWKKAAETARKQYQNGRVSYWKGKKLNNQIREKMRISAFNYVKNRCDILFPCVGHNEKQILDDLEKEIGFNILRQYSVEGYFIDGYIPELNIAIEIDERLKDKGNDIERQKIIESKLGCRFIRINDFE